ncbi:MAG: DUF2625 family protein [Actinomycetota bacterium]
MAELRTLDELTDDRAGAELLIEWIEKAAVPVEILGPSATSGDQLVELQITTASPMGAIVYSTGGIIVDGGWLRILGSGSDGGERGLRRSLVSWNQDRADGFLLIADDTVGGFFAADGGALGGNLGDVHYWAPGADEWLALGLSYSAFLHAVFAGRLAEFAATVRWDGWVRDIATVGGDECLSPSSDQSATEDDSWAVMPVADAWRDRQPPPGPA